MVASYPKAGPYVGLEGHRGSFLRANLGNIYAKPYRRIWRSRNVFTQPQAHPRRVRYGGGSIRAKCYHQRFGFGSFNLVSLYVYPPARLDNGWRHFSGRRIYGNHAYLLFQYPMDGTAAESYKVPA